MAPNVADNWPQCQGIDMTPPDRLENVARLIASQPNKAEARRVAGLVRDRQTKAVADRIIERARELWREKRR